MEQSASLLDQSHSINEHHSQPTTEKQLLRPPQRWNRTFLLNLLRHTPSLLLSLLPRPFQPGGLRRKRKLTPTSYLDALRGYAAWSIMNRHRFDLDKTWLARQPLVRVTHAGPGMVDLFFVISGYVLSYRLVVAMRNRENGAMLEGLTSATFRRYLRLYVSVAVATFVVMVLVSLGCIQEIDMSWYHMDRQPTFLGQVLDWARDVGHFSNPFVAVEGFWFEGVFGARYLYPTWTIPIEFRGSMVLFGFCAAVCKLSTRHRMALCWFTIVLCYYWEAIYIAMFIMGMLIADISLGRHPRRLKPDTQLPQNNSNSTTSPQNSSSQFSLASRTCYTAMCIFALFLLGGPPADLNSATNSFPWESFSSSFPKWGTYLEAHLWPSIGACLMVFVLESYPTLQKPFLWNFSQYLGDLSFGIYLMHQIVMWTVYQQIIDPLRKKYLGDSNWAVTPGVLAYWIAVLWAAEWFMRADSRVVRFGRYLQRTLFVDSDG